MTKNCISKQMHFAVIFMILFSFSFPFTIQQTTFDIFQDIYQGLSIRRICPHFIDECPEKRVEVTFNRTTGSNVGNVFLWNLTIENPRLSWDYSNESLYTMTMSFVEERTENFTFVSYTHWLVTNIPRNEVENGDTIFEFIQPTLEKIETYYMHVVLIFKQKDRIDVQIDQNLNETDTEDIRWSIEMKNFTRTYELGNPEFGSWFYTYRPEDYDEYLMFAHPDILHYFPTKPSTAGRPPFDFVKFS
ncbi:putative odorant-binding protein A5 [Planococcus citri]|uniref:putative odorant-binding protein A5 n=1 Tax=Planococcus citri TaxID=170843 RepID=UPI0031FA40F9